MGADSKGEFLRRTTSKSVSKKLAPVFGLRDTRRGFLKSTADWLKRGAVLAAGTSTARGAFALKSDTEEAVSDVKKAVEGFGGKGDLVDDGGVVIEPIKKSEHSKIPFLKDLDLSGLSDEQVKLGRNMLLEANREMFDLDRILATSTLEDKIRAAARAKNIPEDLFIGLVITESGGDARAVPDPNKRQDLQAAGPTQLMPDIARKYGLKVTNGADDERFIPDRSLSASASEIREEYEVRFGEWSLAFWAYHLGAPQLFDAIRVFTNDVYKTDLPDMKRAGSGKPEAEATAEAVEVMGKYKKLIEEKKLNAFKLLLYPAVRQIFQGPSWNETLKYVSRIYASAAMYTANKSIIEAYRQTS